MSDFDIDKFLLNGNNQDVYQSLMYREVCKTDQEEEWFLGLVTKHVDFVKENKEKPKQVSRKIKQTAEGLDSFIKMHFYEILIKLLCYEYDESLDPSMQLIYWEYLSHKEEFKEVQGIGVFMPDTTYKIYSNDLFNYKMGQGVYYEEDGQTYTNQWALHMQLNKNGKRGAEGESDSAIVNNTLNNIANKKPKENFITERQQAMVLYYLNLAFKIVKDVDVIVFALFAEILLNKKSPNIKNSNLYGYLRDPLKHSNKIRAVEEVIKDLLFVKSIFENVNAKQVIILIELDIRKLENDTRSLVEKE